jgi:OMF family outer membrane factor
MKPLNHLTALGLGTTLLLSGNLVATKAQAQDYLSAQTDLASNSPAEAVGLFSTSDSTQMGMAIDLNLVQAKDSQPINSNPFSHWILNSSPTDAEEFPLAFQNPGSGFGVTDQTSKLPYAPSGIDTQGFESEVFDKGQSSNSFVAKSPLTFQQLPSPQLQLIEESQSGESITEAESIVEVVQTKNLLEDPATFPQANLAQATSLQPEKPFQEPEATGLETAETVASPGPIEPKARVTITNPLLEGLVAQSDLTLPAESESDLDFIPFQPGSQNITPEATTPEPTTSEPITPEPTTPQSPFPSAAEPGSESDLDSIPFQPAPQNTTSEPITPESIIPQSSPPIPALSTVEPESERIQLELLITHPNPLQRPFEPEQVEISRVGDLTLEDAIDLATTNNPNLHIRQLELERQQEALRQQEAQRYPTVTWSGTAQRSRTDTDVDLRSGAATTTAALSSNTGTSNINSNVQMDYNIYDPDRKPSIRAAERQVRQAELVLEQEQEQLQLTVTEAYYNLQEAGAQVEISEQAVSAAERSLQDAQALERAGVGTRFAVLQAEVQLANEQQNLVNNTAALSQARRALVEVLNLPQQVNVKAIDAVDQAGIWPLDLPDSIVLAFANRPELEQRLVEREISEAQRAVARAATRPNLRLFGIYGVDRTATGTSRDDSDTDTASLTNQFQVGVNLQWQLYDGGASKASARQQDISQEIAEVQFSSDRNRIRREVEDAYYDLQANLKNIETAKKGVDQATEALRLARLRFQAGVGTQIDVLNAERDLTQAQGNSITAIIGYNRALVQMQRAVSNFDNPQLQAN